MTFGQVLDYLYGYEKRQALANNRARNIMSAFAGVDPHELWPLFIDKDFLIDEDLEHEAEHDIERESANSVQILSILFGRQA